jgi:hypothetical protein
VGEFRDTAHHIDSIFFRSSALVELIAAPILCANSWADVSQWCKSAAMILGEAFELLGDVTGSVGFYARGTDHL